jgi:TonB family protein
MTQSATWGVLVLALPLIGGVQQSAQPDSDTSRVFVVTDAKKPAKVVEPSYPESAKSAGIQGKVVVDIVVGKTGEVERVQVIGGPKGLWSATTDAVKQWKWEPFLFNGNPILVKTRATINFVLGASRSPKSPPVSR